MKKNQYTLEDLGEKIPPAGLLDPALRNGRNLGKGITRDPHIRVSNGFLGTSFKRVKANAQDIRKLFTNKGKWFQG